MQLLRMVFPRGLVAGRPGFYGGGQRPVYAMRRRDCRESWYAAVCTGLETAGRAGDVRCERIAVERDGVDVPPTTALALRVTNLAGTFLVLTSEHAGRHRVDGVDLDGPIMAVKRD